MADDIFRFRSIWRVPAPLTTVWNTVGKVSQYPTWWPGIAYVQVLAGEELPIAVGTQAAYEVHSPLYTLHYQTEVTAFDTGVFILATSRGDLEGTGKWTFHEEGGETEAILDWHVRLNPLFLRTAAALPGVRSIMRFFHDRLMLNGEKGLQRLVQAELKSLTEPVITTTP